MKFGCEVLLRAKQDQGGEATGLTFTLPEESGSKVQTIALTMAIPHEMAAMFEAGQTYKLVLEPHDTTGDEAPAGERLVD